MAGVSLPNVVSELYYLVFVQFNRGDHGKVCCYI